MNPHSIRVTITQPDEWDPTHAMVTLANEAWDDTGHTIPAHITDAEVVAARAQAAGVLARVAVLAQPHLDDERRAHRCGTYTPGEALTDDPGQWDGACRAWTYLDPGGDGSMAMSLELTVPPKRAKAWAKACRQWLADLATQDTYTPPEAAHAALTPASVRTGGTT